MEGLSWNIIPVNCFSRVWLFATPWTVACQAPLSMEFSRHEDWSGLPRCPLGDLPDPGIEPEPVFLTSLALTGKYFTTSATWEAGLPWWTLNAITYILSKKRHKEIWPQTEQEKAVTTETRNEWCGHKPRNAGSHQRLEEARSRGSLRASGGGRNCTYSIMSPSSSS